MSLRQSPRVTPALVAGNRRNAQQSTGPRTREGKAQARGNALRHGGFASVIGFDPESMRALGEDPAELERLYQDLLRAYQPSDPLGAKQVEDLARLYWRRARLERVREALLRRQIEGLESERRQLQREIDEATFPPTETEAIEVGAPQDLSPPAELRQRLSYLGVLRELVARRQFSPRLQGVMQEIYPEGFDRCPKLIQCMLGWFLPDSYRTPTEEDYRQLRALLDEEIRSVENEFQASLRDQVNVTPTQRDVRLAPWGPPWGLMLRQEEMLDRAIDRKVRILLRLRREKAGLARNQPGSGDESQDLGPAGLLAVTAPGGAEEK